MAMKRTQWSALGRPQKLFSSTHNIISNNCILKKYDFYRKFNEDDDTLFKFLF